MIIYRYATKISLHNNNTGMHLRSCLVRYFPFKLIPKDKIKFSIRKINTHHNLQKNKIYYINIYHQLKKKKMYFLSGIICSENSYYINNIIYYYYQFITNFVFVKNLHNFHLRHLLPKIF